MINLRFLVSFLIKAKKNNIAISHFCKGFRWVKIRNIIHILKRAKTQICPFFFLVFKTRNTDQKSVDGKRFFYYYSFAEIKNLWDFFGVFDLKSHCLC